MASEEHQAADAPAGDAPPQGRSWSGRRTAAAVAVAVGVAAAGGAAIAAGTGGAAAIGNVAFTSDPGYGQGGSGQEGKEGQQGQGERPGGHRGGMGLGNPLHGEFVVADGSGGYVMRLMQSGKVTAVDSGSITVASDDGYSRTYSITDSTTVRGADSAAAIPVDTVVTVIADQGGAALSIGNRPARPEGGPGGPGGPGGHPRGGAPGEQAPGEQTPGEQTPGESAPPAPSDSGTPTEPSSPQPTT